MAGDRPITIEEIWEDSGRRRQTLRAKDLPFRYTGLWILLTIAGLTLLALVVFVWFGFAARPSETVVRLAAQGGTPAESVKAISDLESAWVEQLKSLGQLLFTSTLIPLLGTVAGYVLGARSSKESAD